MLQSRCQGKEQSALLVAGTSSQLGEHRNQPWREEPQTVTERGKQSPQMALGAVTLEPKQSSVVHRAWSSAKADRDGHRVVRGLPRSLGKRGFERQTLTDSATCSMFLTYLCVPQTTSSKIGKHSILQGVLSDKMWLHMAKGITQKQAPSPCFINGDYYFSVLYKNFLALLLSLLIVSVLQSLARMKLVWVL